MDFSLNGNQTGPKNARGYCRVSTVMQEADGVSLETQHTRINDHCRYKNFTLVNFYEDRGISGKNMNRPGLKSLFADLQKEDYVIITDLSRLSRNPRDALEMLAQFDEKGVYLVCLQPDMDFSTPIGRMIFTVLMAVHQLERENIAKHVSNNMQRLSAEGKLRARPPFGWKFVGKNKDYEPEPRQQEVIEKIKEMYLRGGPEGRGMKYAQIARKLNEDGDNLTLPLNKRPSNRKNPPKFHPEQIKRILIDCELVNPAEKDIRIPISKRIVSHRKNVNGELDEQGNVIQDGANQDQNQSQSQSGVSQDQGGVNHNQSSMNLNQNQSGMNQNGVNQGQTGTNQMDHNQNWINQGQTGMNQMNQMNQGQTGMNQMNPDQGGMNQMNQGQTGQTGMNQMNQGQTGMNQMNQGQTGMNQMNQGQTGMNQMNQGQTGMNQMNQGQTGMNQMNPDQGGMNQMNQMNQDQTGMNQGQNWMNQNQMNQNQNWMNQNQMNHNQNWMNQGQTGMNQGQTGMNQGQWMNNQMPGMNPWMNQPMNMNPNYGMTNDVQMTNPPQGNLSVSPGLDSNQIMSPGQDSNQIMSPGQAINQPTEPIVTQPQEPIVTQPQESTTQPSEPSINEPVNQPTEVAG